MIFLTQRPSGTWHQTVIKFPTSPVYCGCSTLRRAKESYFNHVTHTYMYFRIIVYRWIKQILTVSTKLPVSLHYSKCWMWLSSAWTQPQSLLHHCLIASFHYNALLDLSPCLNQPLPQLDLIPVVHASASRLGCNNPQYLRKSRLMTGQMSGLMVTNLTLIFRRTYQITLFKYDFFHTSHSATTVYRWGGKLYNLLMPSFLRIWIPKIIEIRCFRPSYSKIKRVDGWFLRHSVVGL